MYDTHVLSKLLLNTTIRDARGYKIDLTFEFFGSLCINFLIRRASFLSEKYDGGILVRNEKLFVLFAHGYKTRNGRSLCQFNELVLVPFET